MIQPLNMPEPKARCSAMHPERGTQCGLPENHIGQHQNGTMCAPWSNGDYEQSRSAWVRLFENASLEIAKKLDTEITAQ